MGKRREPTELTISIPKVKYRDVQKTLSASSIKMNPIPIPRRFMLGGVMIDVEFDDDTCEGQEALGLAEFHRNRILLKRANAGRERAVDDIEQVFFHELLHFVFRFSGEKKLSEDEVKIDRIARMLHQAFRTAEY